MFKGSMFDFFPISILFIKFKNILYYNIKYNILQIKRLNMILINTKLELSIKL